MRRDGRGSGGLSVSTRPDSTGLHPWLGRGLALVRASAHRRVTLGRLLRLGSILQEALEFLGIDLPQGVWFVAAELQMGDFDLAPRFSRVR